MADYEPRPIVLPLRERPAYRLTHNGPAALNLAELLALVAGGRDPIGVGQALLSHFGDTLPQASPAELQRVPGVGPAAAARIAAALELGLRLTAPPLGDLPSVRSPADAVVLLTPDMERLEQEQVRVLHLDTRNRVIDVELVYQGSLNSCPVRTAELFRGAVRRNCASIILAHNHPSGDPAPSPEDVAVTREAVRAGRLLGIEVLDHIVIGRGGHTSLRERGLGFDG